MQDAEVKMKPHLYSIRQGIKTNIKIWQLKQKVSALENQVRTLAQYVQSVSGMLSQEKNHTESGVD